MSYVHTTLVFVCFFLFIIKWNIPGSVVVVVILHILLCGDALCIYIYIFYKKTIK